MCHTPQRIFKNVLRVHVKARASGNFHKCRLQICPFFSSSFFECVCEILGIWYLKALSGTYNFDISAPKLIWLRNLSVAINTIMEINDCNSTSYISTLQNTVHCMYEVVNVGRWTIEYCISILSIYKPSKYRETSRSIKKLPYNVMSQISLKYMNY